MSDEPDREEFSVVVFTKVGDYHYELRAVSAKEAVAAVVRLLRSVGGRSGIVQKIIIVDGGDYTVLVWEYGSGVTFPTLEMRGLV